MPPHGPVRGLAHQGREQRKGDSDRGTCGTAVRVHGGGQWATLGGGSRECTRDRSGRCAIMGDGGCEGDSDRGVRGTAVGVCRAEGDNNGQ